MWVVIWKMLLSAVLIFDNEKDQKQLAFTRQGKQYTSLPCFF